MNEQIVYYHLQSLLGNYKSMMRNAMTQRSNYKAYWYSSTDLESKDYYRHLIEQVDEQIADIKEQVDYTQEQLREIDLRKKGE